MTVLVVGALHFDVVVRAPRLPTLDETVAGTAVDYVFGGKGGNQAVAISRLGGKVSFAGRAGSDGFGDRLRETLSISGVDIAQLQCDAGPSGMSTAIVDMNGDYGAVIVSAANLNIDPDQIVIPKGTTLLVLQNEIPEAVNTAIALRAQSKGIPVWLNAAPARALPDELLGAVDLFIVNRVEAEFYQTLLQDLDVLTTLGAQGVLYRGRHWPAKTVDVASTHGAGDMFVGALACRVSNGHALEGAIPFAQAAAGWHVSTDQETRSGYTPDALVAMIEGQLNP